jgi:3-methyladenine DNA glycosylase AlkD
MATAQDVLEGLRASARPDQIEGMARYGMSAEGRLGISVAELRKVAREVGHDHALALELWQTGIPEAQIVAAIVAEPAELTEAQMEDWAVDLNSWDVCDQVCMNLFEKTPLAWKKIHDWSKRDQEFVKRAAFALVACLAWHDKRATDEQFIALLPLLKRGATDERNYVKKAVNWALRNIGKRNQNLNKAAIQAAREIQQIDSRAARWIASDALRELESKTTLRRFETVQDHVSSEKEVP